MGVTLRAINQVPSTGGRADGVLDGFPACGGAGVRRVRLVGRGGGGLRLQRVVGAAPDPAPPGDRVAGAAPAAAAGQQQARRRGPAAPAVADRGHAGPDAGGAGRGPGRQGRRDDRLAGDAGAEAAAKKKSLHAAEQDRPDVAAARAAWFERFAGVKVADLVFLDEFGASTNMTRTRARGPRGERVVCKAPHGHWKVLSTVAAMTVAGVVTAGTFEGATDAAAFQAFVSQFLVPRLRPGQVVVMDNLAAHKSARVAELVGSAGCRLILLPPDPAAAVLAGL